MVRCTNCGTENRDDSRFCSNCGENMRETLKRGRREDKCFGQGEKRVEDECFSLPRGGSIVGLIFGVLIIIAGLSLAFGVDISQVIGPFIVIIIGLLIIAGVIYSLSKKTRR